MITGVHHVQITIPPSAEGEARSFYVDLLGLREVDKPEPLRARGGFWLRVGADEVHVGVEDGADRAATRAHIAYEVPDLEAVRTRLTGSGVVATPCPPLPNMERLKCRDPFGNMIEFVRRT